MIIVRLPCGARYRIRLIDLFEAPFLRVLLYFYDMKRSELAFNIALIPLDYCMLCAAALAAYFLRFGSFVSQIRAPQYELPLKEYIVLSLIVAVAWILIFALSGLYSIRGTRSITQELKSIFLACSTAVLVIILVIFFRRELFSSRFIVISAWILSILFVTFGRLFVLKMQRSFFLRGIGVHKVIIIGEGRSAREIQKEIERNSLFGYKIVHSVPYYDHRALLDLKKIQEKLTLDDLIQADPTLPKEDELELVQFCHENHISFRYVPNIYEAMSINVSVSSLAGIPIIELVRTPLDGWGRVAKRLVDILGSLLCIVVTSPLMLAAALAIKWEDKGPIFYKNGRVGYRSQLFEAYKFRSMKSELCTDYKKEISGHESEAEKFEQELIRKQNTRRGALYKIKDDPRVTRVGALLRKYSIDELPQLFNVFKGEMSLIGPRPHQPKEVTHYSKTQMKLFVIKPGITGLAQISGRSDLDFDDESKLDIYYLENWSLMWDIQILFKTPLAVIRNRKTL